MEKAVLWGMIERLIEIGRCCGMGMNVAKTKILRISRQPFPIQIMIGKKQPENVEYFSWLAGQQMLQDVRVKLNLGLPWQNQRLTR